MSNVYDFDRWQRMQQQSASAQLNAAFEHNPDDVAKAFDLSKQTGMDPSTIHDNMDEFTHDYKSELGAQLLRNNEAITNFVNAHPLHAPLIHDDVANLDQATESFKKLKGDPTGEAVKGFSEGFEKPDLPQDPTLASAVNKFISVSPMVQGVKAFGEGFGSEGLGSWVDKQKVEPEWQEWVEKHPETFQSLKQGLGNVGIPLELFTRTFSGVIRGLGGWASAEAQRQGMTETQGNKLGADLAGMAEMQLMGVGVHGAKPPAGVPKLNLDAVKSEIAKLRPYLEAGEPPPPGISEVFDKARAEQSKLAAKALNEAVSDADATKLKQRSPEKLAELLNELPDVPVRISSEAVRKLYGDKAPEPDDGILGWVPGIQDQINHPHVNVSARTLVANIDKDVFKALKDDIASGDNLTLNEAAEPIEYGAEPAGAIKVFHASPHDFEKFDSSKIGTGEGAQTYGYGIYGAESEKVSGKGGEYDKGFTRDLIDKLPTEEEKLAAEFVQTHGSEEAAIKSLKKYLSGGDPIYPPAYVKMLDLLESGWKAPRAKIYEASIDAEPEHFLDWDKPLSEQPKGVRDALKALKRSDEFKAADKAHYLGRMTWEGRTGEFIHNDLKNKLGPERMAEALREAGIPGIRYLDQGSRTVVDYKNEINALRKTIEEERKSGVDVSAYETQMAALQEEAKKAPEQTYNYVVFDDKLLTILSKDGQLLESVRKGAGLEAEPRGGPARPEVDTFASEVLSLARAAGPEAKLGRDLVFINHIWKAYQEAHPENGLDLPTFKAKLREAWQAEKMPLAIASVLEPKWQKDVAESKTQFGRHEWHVIDLAEAEAEPKGSISQAQLLHDAEWELSGADEHLRIAQESAPFTEKFISRIAKGEKSFDDLDSAIQLTAQYVRGMKRKFASISADSEFPALRKLSEVSEAVRKLEEAGAKADLDGALEAIKDVRARLDELGEMRGTKPWSDEDYEREAGPQGGTVGRQSLAEIESLRNAAAEKYGTLTVAQFMEKVEEPKKLAALPKALWDFLSKEIKKVSGDTKVIVMPKEEFPNKVAQTNGWAAYFTSDNKTGDRTIYYDKNYLEKNPEDAARLMLHEAGHDLTMRALYTDVDIANMVRDMLEETRDQAVELSKLDQLLMSYGLADIHEFMSESLSNDHFQTALAAMRLPDDLVSKLGLDLKDLSRRLGRPATMWDAIIQTVRRLIEKAIGRIDNGYSVLEGVLRVTEDIIPLRAAEQARVRRSGKGEGYVIPEDVWQIGKRSEDRANYGGMAGAEAPFDKGAAIGRTQKELSKYEELIAKRDAEDVAWRLKRAERQAKLENSREWKEESDKVRPEVESEVNTRPEVASYRFFSEGYYNGRTLDRKPKLDKNLLTEEQLASIPDQFVSSRGGLPPDGVGNLFGFSNGAELIRSLSTLEGEAASGRGSIVDRLVKAEVYNRVNAKLGESAAERLDEVKDHALGLTPMEMLHEKVLSFAQAAGIKTPISKAEMDAGARKLLGQMDFGTLKSDRLLREAAKSARKISGDLLKDDPLASYKEAQYQYLTTAMAKEARKVEREGKAFERVAKRLKAREQDGLTSEYTNWAHDLLIRLGKDVNRTAKDLSDEIMAEDHHSLESFLDAKEGAGADIYMPDFMVNASFKQDLKDMKVSQAREAMAGVRSLVKAGRDEQKIITAGDKFDKKEFNGKLITQLATIKQTDQPVAKGIRKLGRMVTTNLLNAETVLNRLDRDDAFGLFNYNIGRPMYEGATTKSKLAREVGKQLREIKDDANLREQIPNTIWKNPWEAERPGGMSKWDWANASPLTMTRENFRVVMANMGNADNLDRMARGHGLEPKQIEDWVNQHATEKDWDWVEKLGRDIFGGLNKISANLARQRGAAPPEPIPIEPINTPFGQRSGWYYPIIKDPTIARPGAEKLPDGPLYKGLYQRAGTAQGYTKRRTNSIGPLNLTFDGLARRLSQEIHDISFRDAVVNAMKVFGDADFKNALSKTMGKEYGDMLVNWVKSVANESVGHEAADHVLNQANEYFRQNIIGNLIGLNMHTVEKHTPTAAVNSINEIGAKWFGQAVQELYARDPATGKTGWQFAMEKFEELQRRHQNYVESVSGSQQELLRPSLMKNASSWTFQDYFDIARAKHLEIGTMPVAFFDLMSAVPTALGEYRKQIEAGKSEGDAVYAGNRVVRRAHGSTAITNRPQVMRNYPWVASIYGFWNTMFNRQWEMAWMAKEAAGFATPEAASQGVKTPYQLGMKLFTYVIFPAVVEEYVSSHTNAEKEGYLEWGAKALLRELSSTMPLVRDAVNFAIEGHAPTFGLGTTAVEELTQLYRDVAAHGPKIAFDRNHAGKTLKHALTLFGALSGLANNEEGNIAEYMYNLSTGKERPPSDLKELWRGITKGETRPPTEPDYVERVLPGKTVRGRRR